MPEYRHSHSKAVRSVEEGSDEEKMLLTDKRWQPCPPAVTVDGDPAPVHEDREREIFDDLTDVDDGDELHAIAEAEGTQINKRLKDPDRIRDAIRLARRTN